MFHDATQGSKISRVVIIQGPRYTTTGCPCLKEWRLFGFPEAPVTEYCGNPIGDARPDFCFVVGLDCRGLNWGYCQPPVGDCAIGKVWLVRIDGQDTLGEVVSRQSDGVLLRLQGNVPWVFPWSAIDTLGMDSICAPDHTVASLTTTVPQTSLRLTSGAPVSSRTTDAIDFRPLPDSTEVEEMPKTIVETQWNEVAFFSAPSGSGTEARIFYADDETCESLLQEQSTSDQFGNRTSQLSTKWKLDTTVVGNFTLCFCASSCRGDTASWEHVGSVIVWPNQFGKFVELQHQVGEPFDVTLETQELEDFNDTGRLKIVWARSRGECRAAEAGGVKGTSCQPGGRTASARCSEGFVEGNSSSENLVRMTWFEVVVNSAPSSSPEFSICYCDPRASCNSPTGWLLVGRLRVTFAKAKGSPTEGVEFESSVCSAGAYEPSRHGPPLGLRLIYNIKHVKDAQTFVKRHSGSLRETVAESLEESEECVQILHVWNGSVIIAFGVTPHRCSATSATSACEAHIVEDLQSRWRAAVQNPRSPLRLHFGSKVDTSFPTFLDDHNCISHGLSCQFSGTANSLVATVTATQESVDSGDSSEEPKQTGTKNRVRKSQADSRSEKWNEFWSFGVEQEHRGWVTALVTCALTTFVGFACVKGVRRSRVLLRRRAHASEIKKDVGFLENLGRVEISLAELGDRSQEGCSICLGPFEATEELLLLPCGHLLHYECVLGWLQRRPTCPLCRCPMAVRECLVHVVRESTDDERRSNQLAQMGSECHQWCFAPSTLANRVALYSIEAM